MLIFIYKHDKFGKGLPVYHINRHIEETGELFSDGSHIIYVNGKYKGDDEVGRLIRDSHQSEAGKRENKVLADGVKHFKETKGGRKLMCEAVDMHRKFTYMRASTNRRLFSGQGFVSLFKTKLYF